MAHHGDTLDVPPAQPHLPAAHPRPHSDQPTLGEARATAKLSRRESRLGLKNIFGRSKPAKEPDPVPHTIQAPRSTRIRASLAEMGHWPHGHHSDAALSSSTPWSDLPEGPEPPQPDQMAPEDQTDRKGGLKSPRRPRAAVANWSMPSLSKAFPQAVSHVTLPAATMSADTILRLNEKKHVMAMVDEAAAAVQGLKDGNRGDRDKEKRKHRRNISTSADSLEWTTKIFVLVTSGYLLQYAGDGHFDRLPEKALRLGPSSAAFASDAIPGRHWVVHVSSTADADSAPASESRSLFAKLPFRIDRRSTSNLLMVFESAEVMEAWISTLRGEIERLGGKKKLTETGRPKTTEGLQPIGQRHGRQALAVDDMPRRRDNEASPSTSRRAREVASSEGLARVASLDAAGDLPLDDDSTSSSGVSQDEDQLDSLREHSQRYSLISSGQRTVVTSEGPSPEPSPTRERTASRADKASLTRPGGDGADAVVRPRPNASSIASRRQSVQVVCPFVDVSPPDGHADVRSPSACGGMLRGDGALSPAAPYPTPNFSLPHSANRRFSHARIPLAEADYLDRAGEAAATGAARSKPPPAARTTHTLSVVMDQPAPLLEPPPPPRPATGHGGRRLASPTKRAGRQRLRSTSHGRQTSAAAFATWTPDGGTSLATEPRWHYGFPRSPPTPGDDYEGDGDGDGGDGDDDGDDDDGRRWSDRRQRRSREARGPSSLASSEASSPSYQAHSPPLLAGPGRARRATGSPARIQPHASSPHLKVQMTERALLNRRSMPQLLAGPPPAPPPTRALPPIPQNLQLRA